MNVVRKDEGSITNKELRLKTETNERESNDFQKRHTKTGSNIVYPNKEDQFSKTITLDPSAYK
jgi:hypothetical protein